MMGEAIKNVLQKQLEHLDLDPQRQVLVFAQALTAKGEAGTAGRELARFAGIISRSDLDIISAEIEAGCQQ